MAIYLELPVYKTCYELYLEFVKVRRALPREERYTIGQELDRVMVEVLVLLQRINATRDKVPLIGRARQLVAEIQIRMRVLKDVKALSVGHFTTLFDLSESVSKQLTSWQKFSQRGCGGAGRAALPGTALDANAPSCRDGRPESAESRFGGARHKANPMRNDAASSVYSDNGDPTANTEVTS